MAQIPVGKEHFAVVDDDMVPLVSKHRWTYSLRVDKTTAYATTKINGRTVYMHRLLMAASGRLEIDHRDGDGLNNRLHNLRFATRRQNQANRRKQTGPCLSKFKGVTFDRFANKWKAQLMVTTPEGKEVNLHLGRFRDERDAAIAYNAAAILHFGEFAKLNILPD